MSQLIIILAIVTGLSYMSQRYSMNTGKKGWDIYLIILLIFLILFAGLRTSYNDTINYSVGFQNSETISAFLSNRENLELLNNPLFYGFQALIKTFTNNLSKSNLYAEGIRLKHFQTKPQWLYKLKSWFE